MLSGPIKGKKVDLTETLNVNFIIDSTVDSTAEKNILVEHVVEINCGILTALK